MSKSWVARCVGAFSEQHDTIIVSELGCQLADMTLTRPDCYFKEPPSGGLGWGLAAALGFQLAERERLVVATVGDGSYMFANPVACHQIAEAYDLPLLTIVLNNSGWNAVRHATLALYPDDAAAKANVMPLTTFSPSPDFVKVGASVKEGDTLVIVEAMKVMNPIAADKSGTVKAILIENAQPVEFDQPLVVIG